MTLEDKYKYAIMTLQAIAQRNGESKDGYINEWTESEAFYDCRRAARITLIELGEKQCLNYKEDKL